MNQEYYEFWMSITLICLIWSWANWRDSMHACNTSWDKLWKVCFCKVKKWIRAKRINGRYSHQVNGTIWIGTWCNFSLLDTTFRTSPHEILACKETLAWYSNETSFQLTTWDFPRLLTIHPMNKTDVRYWGNHRADWITSVAAAYSRFFGFLWQVFWNRLFEEERCYLQKRYYFPLIPSSFPTFQDRPNLQQPANNWECSLECKCWHGKPVSLGCLATGCPLFWQTTQVHLNFWKAVNYQRTDHNSLTCLDECWRR